MFLTLSLVVFAQPNSALEFPPDLKTFVFRHGFQRRGFGLAEWEVHQRTQWYLEVLARSTYAKLAAEIEDKQIAKIEALIGKWPDDWLKERRERLSRPTSLTAESLDFLREPQRRWFAMFIVKYEGMLALRHPLVATELGIDEKRRKQFWRLTEQRLPAAEKHWQTFVSIAMVGDGGDPRRGREAADALAELFKLAFEYEIDVWKNVLTADARKKLVESRWVVNRIRRALTREVPFPQLVPIGEP